MVVRARSEKRTGWYQTPSVAIYLFCLLFFFFAWYACVLGGRGFLFVLFWCYGVVLFLFAVCCLMWFWYRNVLKHLGGIVMGERVR